MAEEERRACVSLDGQARIETEEAIATSDVEFLLDALARAILGATGKEFKCANIGKLEYQGVEDSAPDGIEPEFREAFIRADKRAQALDIAPFEYMPESPEDQYRWPHLTIQFCNLPDLETRDILRSGIKEMRKIVSVYREEGVPFLNELTIYPDPIFTWDGMDGGLPVLDLTAGSKEEIH